MDVTNRVQLKVPWHEEGLNLPGSTKEQKQYFKELSEKYYAVLKEAVDRIIPKRMEEEKNIIRIVHKGTIQSFHAKRLYLLSSGVIL